MKNLLEHVGIVASVSGLIFVAIRLFSVSGGSAETAAAILQSQGTGTVLMAAILTFIPVVPMIATNLWIFWIKYSRGKFLLIDLPILATLLILVALLTPWLVAAVFIVITIVGEIAQRTINKNVFKNAFQRVREQIDRARNKTRESVEEGAATSKTPDGIDPSAFIADEVNSLMSDLPKERLQALMGVVVDGNPKPASGVGLEDVETFISRAKKRGAARDVLLEVLDDLTVVLEELDSPAPIRWRGLESRLLPLDEKLKEVADPNWDRYVEVLGAVSSARERATRYEALSERLLSVTLIGIGTVTALLVGFGAIFLPMWAPLERVEHGNTASVGYVLGRDDDELVVLKDRPRGVVRIENATGRSFCIEASAGTDHRFVRWMTDPTPILGFTYPPRLRYPSCSRSIPDNRQPTPDRSFGPPAPMGQR